ncbi:ParB/RepB/Spo0J family partition protein [bacterium]|nr:ParB/RepB/Spo0J family partition protein [bacterium]
MGKRNALGRGLEALLPGSVSEVLSGEEVLNIPIDNIFPNPEQPRKIFDEDALNSLAESIRTQGVLQPILLHRAKSGYEIVAGERRFRAAILAGLKRIRAIVISEKDPQVLLFFSLVENLQRENLSALEEAEAYKRLSDEFDLTQEQIAEKVGKSRSAVANTLRLLNLPEEVKSFLTDGQLSAGHARALLATSDDERLIRLAHLAVSRGLSVERLEILAREDKPSPRHRKTGSTKKRSRHLTPEIAALEDAFKSHLATKVKINLKPKGGTITIEFFNDEDLMRIAEIISED